MNNKYLIKLARRNDVRGYPSGSSSEPGFPMYPVVGAISGGVIGNKIGKYFDKKKWGEDYDPMEHPHHADRQTLGTSAGLIGGGLLALKIKNSGGIKKTLGSIGKAIVDKHKKIIHTGNLSKARHDPAFQEFLKNIQTKKKK